jgi:hypothetical protein
MLLRLCGKYIHLMRDLKPIASDVFLAMTQLLDFYVLVVYTFFTKDLSAESRLKVADHRLLDIVEKIEKDLIKREVPLNPKSVADGMAKSPIKSVKGTTGNRLVQFQFQCFLHSFTLVCSLTLFKVLVCYFALWYAPWLCFQVIFC